MGDQLEIRHFRPTACLDWVNEKRKKKSAVKVAVNQRALNAPLKGFEGQYKASGWNKGWNRGNNGSNNKRVT